MAASERCWPGWSRPTFELTTPKWLNGSGQSSPCSSSPSEPPDSCQGSQPLACQRLDLQSIWKHQCIPCKCIVHILDSYLLYFKQVKQSHSPQEKHFFPRRKWQRQISFGQAIIDPCVYLAVPSTMKRCITGAILDPIPSSTSNILFSTFSTAFWMRVMRVRRQDRTTASPFSDEAWREPKISSIPEKSKYAYQTLTSFKWPPRKQRPRGMGRLSGVT